MSAEQEMEPCHICEAVYPAAHADFCSACWPDDPRRYWPCEETRTTDRQTLRDDIITRYENTLRSLDDGWRTIESAPTDWTQVDLWVVWQGLGQRITDCRSSLANGKTDWHTTSDEYGWTKVHGTPTHWMPLPAPPALPAAFRRV